MKWTGPKRHELGVALSEASSLKSINTLNLLKDD